MRVEDFIFYIFAAVSTLYILHFGFYLAGANIYDIWQFRRKLSQKQRIKFPFVSIVISAHNEEKVIVRCIESIRRTGYPNYEILVADDASEDSTRQRIKDYMIRNPDVKVRVYRMHKNVGKGRALSTILRRYAKGELAMTLDADSIIAPDAIANAITYFDDPTVAGVAANVQIIDEHTVLGVLQKFEHMIGYRAKKVYSLFNCEYVVGGVASTYRMKVLRNVNFYDFDTVTEDIGLSIKIISKGNKKCRMVYGADVAAMTEGVDNFKALVRQRYRWKYGSFQNLVKYHRLIGNLDPRYTSMLTVYRLPMAIVSEFILLSTPFVWAYILYMSFVQYSLGLIIGAYLTITGYMLLTIWFDEHLPLHSRFRLTLYAPIAYFIFYIMDLIQLIAIARCLGRAHHLVMQKDAGSVWISPRRIGRELTMS
jgi:poly-beta-1,6-N-acetyl-D-glucosamine synthase